MTATPTIETSKARRKRRTKALAEPLIIAVDTREQRPYDFGSVTEPVIAFDHTRHVETRTLPTGDYSAVGYESEIAIERKSLSDAYGSFGTGRSRFEREIIRMSEFVKRGGYAAVVIEAEWSELLLNPPRHSAKMRPKSIVASIIAWGQRHGVQFWTVPGREFGERLTHRLIERFVRDRRGA